MADILALSPLAGHPIPPMPDVVVAEVPVGSLVQVAAFAGRAAAVSAALEAAGFPALPAPTASTAAGGHTMLDIGPGRGLLLSDTPGLAAALEAAVPVDDGTVTDLSHARVAITVSGPRAVWVLGKGVPLDLDLSAFPVGTSVATQVEHVGVILHRTAADAFTLLPYRGFALTLMEWLTVAGRVDTP